MAFMIDIFGFTIWQGLNTRSLVEIRPRVEEQGFEILSIGWLNIDVYFVADTVTQSLFQLSEWEMGDGWSFSYGLRYAKLVLGNQLEMFKLHLGQIWRINCDKWPRCLTLKFEQSFRKSCLLRVLERKFRWVGSRSHQKKTLRSSSFASPPCQRWDTTF